MIFCNDGFIIYLYNPSEFKGCDQCLVELVSWYNIQVFLEKLNGWYPGKNDRLPTEAEWEYAARGCQLSKGYLYAGSNKLDEVGWYDENSDRKTHAVGQKQPNELGIYDMSGNVYEWCQDWNNEAYYQTCYNQGVVVNPTGLIDGKYKILRGGSWRHSAHNCHVLDRNLNISEPNDRINFTGFRLAQSF